jgi:hypothetical protein
MPQVELADQHRVEPLADIFKRVMKHLAGVLRCANVHAGGERNQVREPSPGHHLVDVIQETVSVVFANVSEPAVCCSYIRGMEGYGDSYLREETSLNLVQPSSQVVDLTFVDGNSAYDEVVLDFPSVGVARLV